MQRFARGLTDYINAEAVVGKVEALAVVSSIRRAGSAAAAWWLDLDDEWRKILVAAGLLLASALLRLSYRRVEREEE